MEAVATAVNDAKTEELTKAPPPTVAAATTTNLTDNRAALCMTVPDKRLI